jgi:hypothetical protein
MSNREIDAATMSHVFHYLATVAANRAAAAGRKPFEVAEVVILAVSTSEAGINEVIEWLENDQGFKGLPPNFKQSNILAKWSSLPKLAGRSGFDEQSAPWQDFEMLVNTTVSPTARW